MGLITERFFPIFDRLFPDEATKQVGKIISKLLFGRGIELKPDFDIRFKSRRDFRKELRIKTSARRLEYRGTADKGRPGLKETRFQGLTEDYGVVYVLLKEDVFRELRIEDCKVSSRTLCLSLWRHQKTLHRVELSKIIVDSDDNKFTLFKCLRNELQLEHLEWTRVQFTTGWDRKIETFDNAELTSKEHVAKALTELLSAETGNVVEDWKEDLSGWEEELEDLDSLDGDSLDQLSP